MKKRYIQLDRYARVVIEEFEVKRVVYLEWNSFPYAEPNNFKMDVELTMDVLGESMLITDNDMDVYAAIEQCRAYWNESDFYKSF